MRQIELFEDSEPKKPVELSTPPVDDRVLHEIHRLMGFLRFTPDSNGVYTARCSPDYFILPALARHFYLRFGEGTAWAIIDEKRDICLYREINSTPRLKPASQTPASESDPKTTNGLKNAPGFDIASDFYEELWRLYHRSVNNESRKNPRLQRQFMPERYRKYLSELK